MKKQKSGRKLRVSSETLVKLDQILQSVAGGCDNVSGCPECEPISCRIQSCWEIDKMVVR